MANSRRNFLTQAITRADPSHNYDVELLYQRRTRVRNPAAALVCYNTWCYNTWCVGVAPCRRTAFALAARGRNGGQNLPGGMVGKQEVIFNDWSRDGYLALMDFPRVCQR